MNDKSEIYKLSCSACTKVGVGETNRTLNKIKIKWKYLTMKTKLFRIFRKKQIKIF